MGTAVGGQQSDGAEVLPPEEAGGACGCVGGQGSGGTLLWGTSAWTALDPFPLEGRTGLLLSWPQYSSFLQGCCVPWCSSVFGEGIGSRMGVCEASGAVT